MSFTYKYDRPALTVDCVVFGYAAGTLEILLIRRNLAPYQGCWALPGGFFDTKDDTIDAAARRELLEETGIKNLYLEQLQTFGDRGRDPRERVVSVAYLALVKRSDHQPQAGDDAAEARWTPRDALPPLAFDHDQIITTALERLRGKIRWQPIGFELLPREFTLQAIQHLYEAILGRPLDKRNFRKKLLSFGILTSLEKFSKEQSKRPARLYRFNAQAYRQKTQKGFLFDL